MVPAIRPDVALFHAPEADRFGNVRIGRQTELAAMAHASKATLVTVERVSDTSLLADENQTAGVLPSALRERDRRGRQPAHGRWGCGANTPPTTPSRALRGDGEIRRRLRRLHERLRATLRGGGVTAPPATGREILIATIADQHDGVRTVAVGMSSPIPAAGVPCCFARAHERLGRAPVRVIVLGSREHNFHTNGAFELFDAAAQGRIDAFFLGGGEIDGRANINLVGTAPHRATTCAGPARFGSAFLYYVVPRVILFREEHSPRLFVDQGGFHQRAPASARA